MNCSVPCATARSMSVLNCSRPPVTLRCTTSSSPGSDRQGARLEGADLGRIDVQAEHVVAHFCQAGPGDEADVTGADTTGVRSAVLPDAERVSLTRILSIVDTNDVIDCFADKRTAAIFQGLEVRGLPREIQGIARRKLKIVDAAPSIEALRVPPGNRLEPLKGDRKGQWSIRINDQWRICFRWKDGVARDVEIVDYH